MHIIGQSFFKILICQRHSEVSSIEHNIQKEVQNELYKRIKIKS